MKWGSFYTIQTKPNDWYVNRCSYGSKRRECQNLEYTIGVL